MNYLQTGMFKSDDRFLAIMKDIYSDEDVEALSKMGSTAEDINKLAENFGLINAQDKIRRYKNKKEININIAGIDYRFKDETPI
jgi:hypothetical protein